MSETWYERWERFKMNLKQALNSEQTKDLYLDRFWSNGDATIGRLYFDNRLICYTIEDEFRAKKVRGETRIPKGYYKVLWNWSPRFKRNMLLLEDVPGFSGIRIHSGNTDDDTEGCIIPGKRYVDAMVFDSRAALKELENLVVPYAKKGLLWIRIEDNDREDKTIKKGEHHVQTV